MSKSYENKIEVVVNTKELKNSDIKGLFFSPDADEKISSLDEYFLMAKKYSSNYLCDMFSDFEEYENLFDESHEDHQSMMDVLESAASWGAREILVGADIIVDIFKGQDIPEIEFNCFQGLLKIRKPLDEVLNNIFEQDKYLIPPFQVDVYENIRDLLKKHVDKISTILENYYIQHSLAISAKSDCCDPVTGIKGFRKTRTGLLTHEIVDSIAGLSDDIRGQLHAYVENMEVDNHAEH